MESIENPEVVPGNRKGIEDDPPAEAVAENEDRQMELRSASDNFAKEIPTIHSSGSILGDDGELWPSYCNPSYRMPDQIDVKVKPPTGDVYFFPVIIVKSSERKRYLGGYRNKLTGYVYHHASTQTPTEQRQAVKDTSNLRTRDTQTSETRTLSIQCHRETGTQMERIDLVIDNRRDVVKYPKPYFTSDELMLKRKAALIEIQRCWRGYMARSLAQQIRQRNIDYANEQQKLIIQRQKEEQEQRVRDMARRTHPKTNADFAALYNELDNWRKAEVAKIKASSAGADPEERRLAMAELLANETKALQGLQKLKQAAQQELENERTQKMLERMAMPHTWQLSKGESSYIQVHTQETQRAKELLDLFNALNAPLLDMDQRLDVLLNVKWTVRELISPLTKEIMELVDREADLLQRGRSSRSMEALRTRISHLFLRFLEHPHYNPRAGDFIVEK